MKANTYCDLSIQPQGLGTRDFEFENSKLCRPRTIGKLSQGWLENEKFRRLNIS
jgi:hypothetical protein